MDVQVHTNQSKRETYKYRFVFPLPIAAPWKTQVSKPLALLQALCVVLCTSKLSRSSPSCTRIGPWFLGYHEQRKGINLGWFQNMADLNLIWSNIWLLGQADPGPVTWEWGRTKSVFKPQQHGEMGECHSFWERALSEKADYKETSWRLHGQPDRKDKNWKHVYWD